mmetsp:Transcript_18323/g.17445  ORF Transcript_18323/g.17445 Transcript_18323/m.17445 type:complete len:86 (+) Transcript_18323:583-840(+)
MFSRNGARFNNEELRISMDKPGPGAYKQVLAFSRKGNYQYSKWKSSGAPVFTRQGRQTNLDTSATRKITPGPGSYRMQTEFGFYD